MAEGENKDPNLEKKSDSEGAADDGSGAGSDGGGEAKDPLLDYTPEVRKTPADYFRERHEARRPAAPPKEGEGAEEGGEELTPAAKTVLAAEVERQVRERLAPYETVVVNSANESEIASYIGSHEEHRKYAPVARKYMDVYKGITAENAFLLAEAKFGNPVERGAEAERARRREAQRARGGSSPRPPARPAGAGEITAEEIQAMTPDQFAAFNERIKGGAQIKT